MNANIIDSSILNFLNNEISFTITDTVNRSASGSETLRTKESTLLKVFNREYEIRVTYVKGVARDTLFKLVPSKNIAFMEDSSLNQIFIMDLITKKRIDPISGSNFLPSSVKQNTNATTIVSGGHSSGVTIKPSQPFNQFTTPSSAPAYYSNTSSGTSYINGSIQASTNYYPNHNNSGSFPQKLQNSNVTSTLGTSNGTNFAGTSTYIYNSDNNKPYQFTSINTNVTPHNQSYISSNYTYNTVNPNFSINTIVDPKSNFNINKPYAINFPPIKPTTPVTPIVNPLTPIVAPLTIDIKGIEKPKEPENSDSLKNFGDLGNLLKDALESGQAGPEKDLSKIYKDVFDSRLNTFAQLHRHNLDDPSLKKLLPEKDEIKIINSSDDTLFLRLSGKTDKTKEYWTSVEPGHFHLFDRKKNTIYKLHINNTESKDGGFVYIVKSGVVYQIDQNNNLMDLSQSHVCSISNNFHPLFEVVYGVFYNKDDISMYNKSAQKKIIIINRSNTKTYMVNVAEDEEGSHDFIEIDPHLFVIFKRNALKSTATVTKKGDDLYLQKYNLETEYVYEFEDDSDDLMDITSVDYVPAEKIELNSTEIKLNNYLTSNYEKKNIRRKLWEQIRTYSALSDKRKKIKDFSMLLFSYIIFHNESNENIFVRVLPKKIGSESFQEVAPGEKVEFKRLAGFYPAEICTFEAKPFAIFVKSDNIYSYKSPDDCKEHQKRNFIPSGTEEDNIHNTNAYMINPVKKMLSKSFTVDRLLYFDHDEGILKSKQLVYPETEVEVFKTTKIETKSTSEKIITNPKLLGELEKGKKTNEKSVEEQDDDDYDDEEYFLNIKPNYVPGKPFVDPMFPPDDSSLKGYDPTTKQRRKTHFFHIDPDNMHPQSKKKLENLKFMRPNDIWRKKYELFADGIDCEDIKQGSLGNCYLISVIAALGKRPDLIKQIFKTQSANPDGFYEIYYFEDGKKKVMFVDDYIPTDSGKFYFARPNGEELWAVLLEKAFAKYEGGYALIDGGQMYKEFSFFTGAMGRYIQCNSPNYWNEIYNALNTNFFVTAMSKTGTGNHFNKTQCGIANGHAYTVLSAKEYRDASQVIRLVRLRNPWGHTEFNGDFSDESNKWTPQLKEYFGFESDKNLNDGIFFMPYDIFLREYSGVVICCLDTGVSRR